jgi:subtilisin-like proprotein convertase family protein
VESKVTVAGCSGKASATSKVEVHIKHPYRGDLAIDLVAPDGTRYRLKSATPGDGRANVDATYTVDASSELRTGVWKLRVTDAYRFDTGHLDSWSLTP